jgi:hypothetical protein
MWHRHGQIWQNRGRLACHLGWAERPLRRRIGTCSEVSSVKVSRDHREVVHAIQAFPFTHLLWCMWWFDSGHNHSHSASMNSSNARNQSLKASYPSPPARADLARLLPSPSFLPSTSLSLEASFPLREFLCPKTRVEDGCQGSPRTHDPLFHRCGVRGKQRFPPSERARPGSAADVSHGVGSAKQLGEWVSTWSMRATSESVVSGVLDCFLVDTRVTFLYGAADPWDRSLDASFDVSAARLMKTKTLDSLFYLLLLAFLERRERHRSS